MRSILFSLAGFCLASPSAAQEPLIAFTDVHVVPMTRDTVLEHMTVVVRDRRIATIEPASRARVPSGARIIEGQGRSWLVPGLADMHVHMFDRGEMTMYLANGITTVLNLHGISRHLAWRDSIERGEIVGPRLITSGPILDGDPPSRGTNTVLRTRADVREAVEAQNQAGYDLLKVYDNLPRDLYEELISQARKHRLRLAGHVPTPVGLDGLLELNGQSVIEHAEELLPFLGPNTDSTRLAAAAGAIAERGIWITPTVTVFQSALDQATSFEAVLRRPEMAFLNPETFETWGWKPTGEGRNGNQRARQVFENQLRFFETRLIPALHKAGVRFMTGTDAPIPAIVPGFSLQGELEMLVRAGFTPFEALAAATTNPAIFLEREGEFGTIVAGSVADLVLLEANPLENIAHLTRRKGVMRAGVWLSQAQLSAMLEEIRLAHASH